MGTGDRRARRHGAAVAALAVLLLTPITACADGGDAAGGRSTSSSSGTADAEAADAALGDGVSTTDPASLDGREVTVTSITDGDTFRAADERVRLIGIDTPEVDRGDCGADAASAELGALIPIGTRVVLVSDVDPLDRYDRTLAYVHRAADGLHVNLAMAREGYAVPLVVEPNDAHAAEIDAAARDAVADGRGLWDGTCPPPPGLGAVTGSSTPSPSTLAEPPASATTGGGDDRAGCEPAYPTVCIPPSPPDLDCADIPHRRFPVLAPDPHRFDGGGDGIGCER